MRSSTTATVTTRYSFTAQFIAGSVLLARRAAEIETEAAPSPERTCEHRAFVVGAILQSSAALEDEVGEIVQHGPGHHLGSNEIDHAAHAFVSPLAEIIDRQPGVLARYDLLLHLLRRPPLERDRQPYQDADLLVSLRNELVHYRSRDGGAMKTGALLRALKSKNFAPPPFVNPATNFFPRRLLGAACATWACEIAVRFIDYAYELIGKPSVLDGQRAAGADYQHIIPKRRSR